MTAADREQAWRDVARCVRILRSEQTPLADAVMVRDPHQLRAVADALAQAVQTLVMNASVLAEDQP